MNRVYPSKIAWWFTLLFWLLIAYLVWEAFRAFFVSTPADSSFGIQTLILSLVVVALFLAFIFPVRYELSHSELLIKGGLFSRRKIPLDSVTEARPSHNAAAAMALSLDRVMIRFTRDGVENLAYVSPKQQRDFLKSLAESAPNMRYTLDKATTGSDF